MAEIVLQRVMKNYGPLYAVNDVSLTVNDGEFVALVGPSGCGTTTTLNRIAGLLPMSGGDATPEGGKFFGPQVRPDDDLAGGAPAIRRKCGHNLCAPRSFSDGASRTWSPRPVMCMAVPFSTMWLKYI